ncbi:TolC family protein [Granulicella sp. WH15]|uniref:TolC family protein n=1 Tax=Granulicella sp. WH15 TaxID=2602070 RepID=UPI001367053D|nr:TolC family protein [Granulicella sp. WH15]QHN02882.1 TolC family protein [Granulicella sp. WH15]
MKLFTLTTLALLLPCAVPAQTSTPPPPPQVLTLEDAIAMAEHNSPRLHSAAAITARADAATLTARAYTNPSVEVYAGHQYARPIATPGVPGLLQHYAAYQPIEIPSERRARLHAAQLAAISSRQGEAGVARSVAAEVERTFYDVLRRREEIEQARENLQLVEDLRHRVEVEVTVGEKGRLELTRAEAEQARAGFALRSTQLELSNAIALLRVAIAAPADSNLDPRGSLEDRLHLPPLTELRELVLNTHPAIAKSQADIQTAEAALEHERKLRIPRPTIFAEFENQPDLRYWRTGVTVPLPLWDRRRGQISESKATILQTQAELEAHRLELISAVERAFEQYQLADQQVTSLQSGELHAAESAVDAAKAAYRFGERGIVEVLDAQRVLQSVRGDLLDAQYARQSALIDLEELGAVAPGRRP